MTAKEKLKLLYIQKDKDYNKYRAFCLECDIVTFKELEEMAASLSIAIKEYELATKDRVYLYMGEDMLKIGNYGKITADIIQKFRQY